MGYYKTLMENLSISKLFNRQRTGDLTILLLFTVDVIFLLVNDYLNGFPTLDGIPVIEFQIMFLVLIIGFWLATFHRDYKKSPNIVTLIGIFCGRTSYSCTVGKSHSMQAQSEQT
jgi:hypothetical protein